MISYSHLVSSRETSFADQRLTNNDNTDPEHIDRYEFARAECEENSAVLPSLDIIDNFTEQDIDDLETIDYEGFLALGEELVNSTTLISQDLAQSGENTVVSLSSCSLNETRFDLRTVLVL